MTDFDDFFQNAPGGIDLPALRAEWLALATGYDLEHWQLPLPLWAQRPFEDQGPRAWQILQSDLEHSPGLRPISIYLHIPFCTSKCGFCDSYSFKLGSQQDRHITAYLDRLCAELRLWSRVGNLNRRPVTTLHLGGGTPASLGAAGLARLTACLRECFNLGPATEWALETTTTSLTPHMADALHALGFRRLHIGVQSMEDAVRTGIGRRSSAASVCRAVEAALERGWVVSVDLLCGLPGQTLPGFTAGIETLAGLGVNGFSLYELLVRRQNYRWVAQHGLAGRSHLPNYFMLQAGANLLERRGYRKNLFNHWADARDTNTYFTFPERGEDLLALGAIADGVFGDYHYRHPLYAGYMAAGQEDSPGLAGGLRRTASESHFRPYEIAMLSGHIPAALAAKLRGTDTRGDALIERWQAHRMVSAAPAGGLDLTSNGTWFTGNLVAEARAVVLSRFAVVNIPYLTL